MTQEQFDDLQDFADMLVDWMAKQPETKATVTRTSGGACITVDPHPHDTALFIGRNGYTFKAIKALLRAWSAGSGVRIAFEVRQPNGRTRATQ